MLPFPGCRTILQLLIAASTLTLLTANSITSSIPPNDALAYLSPRSPPSNSPVSPESSSSSDPSAPFSVIEALHIQNLTVTSPGLNVSVAKFQNLDIMWNIDNNPETHNVKIECWSLLKSRGSPEGNWRGIYPGE